MKKLTANQQRAWDFRKTGMTYSEIAIETGQRSQEVRNAYLRAAEKMKINERFMDKQDIEVTNPEAAAAALDMLTDGDFEKLNLLTEELNIPRSMMIAFKQRLKMKYKGLEVVIGQIKTPIFQGKIDGIINAGLDSIDEIDFMKASLRDKASTICMFIEKRQLLAGEPTQILSINERKEVNDLIPLLMDEARRRGVMIDIDPATGKVLATQPQC